MLSSRECLVSFEEFSSLLSFFTAHTDCDNNDLGDADALVSSMELYAETSWLHSKENKYHLFQLVRNSGGSHQLSHSVWKEFAHEMSQNGNSIQPEALREFYISNLQDFDNFIRKAEQLAHEFPHVEITSIFKDLLLYPDAKQLNNRYFQETILPEHIASQRSSNLLHETPSVHRNNFKSEDTLETITNTHQEKIAASKDNVDRIHENIVNSMELLNKDIMTEKKTDIILPTNELLEPPGFPPCFVTENHKSVLKSEIAFELLLNNPIYKQYKERNIFSLPPIPIDSPKTAISLEKELQSIDLNKINLDNYEIYREKLDLLEVKAMKRVNIFWNEFGYGVDYNVDPTVQSGGDIRGLHFLVQKRQQVEQQGFQKAGSRMASRVSRRCTENSNFGSSNLGARGSRKVLNGSTRLNSITSNSSRKNARIGRRRKILEEDIMQEDSANDSDITTSSVSDPEDESSVRMRFCPLLEPPEITVQKEEELDLFLLSFLSSSGNDYTDITENVVNSSSSNLLEKVPPLIEIQEQQLQALRQRYKELMVGLKMLRKESLELKLKKKELSENTIEPSNISQSISYPSNDQVLNQIDNEMKANNCYEDKMCLDLIPSIEGPYNSSTRPRDGSEMFVVGLKQENIRPTIGAEMDSNICLSSHYNLHDSGLTPAPSMNSPFCPQNEFHGNIKYDYPLESYLNNSPEENSMITDVAMFACPPSVSHNESQLSNTKQ